MIKDCDSGVSFCTFTATLLFPVRIRRVSKKTIVKLTVVKTNCRNCTGLLIDRFVNIAAHARTYALSEQITFSGILYAIETLQGVSSSIVEIVFVLTSATPSSVLFPATSSLVSVLAHFRSFLVAV